VIAESDVVPWAAAIPRHAGVREITATESCSRVPPPFKSGLLVQMFYAVLHIVVCSNNIKIKEENEEK